MIYQRMRKAGHVTVHIVGETRINNCFQTLCGKNIPARQAVHVFGSVTCDECSERWYAEYNKEAAIDD